MSLIIALDGVFELVLGVLLITAAAASPSDALVMAGPASRPIIIGFGVLLLPAGVVLLAVWRRLSTLMLRGLAVVNAASGLVIGAWLMTSWAGFSQLGRALAGVTAAGLIVLAIAELYISNITSST